MTQTWCTGGRSFSARGPDAAARRGAATGTRGALVPRVDAHARAATSSRRAGLVRWLTLAISSSPGGPRRFARGGDLGPPALAEAAQPEHPFEGLGRDDVANQ